MNTHPPVSVTDISDSLKISGKIVSTFKMKLTITTTNHSRNNWLNLMNWLYVPRKNKAAVMRLKSLAVLLLIFMSARAQSFDFGGSSRDCGTWVPEPAVLSGWHTVDTVGKYKPALVHDWVYDAEYMDDNHFQNAVWCPCGCPDPIMYIQYRICRNTGVRQIQRRIINYDYVPAPVSAYKKTVDSLTPPVKYDSILYRCSSSTSILQVGRALTIKGDSVIWSK